MKTSVWQHSNLGLCMHAKLLQLCLTLCDPMDCRPQTPLSMGFSGQEHWSGLPCPPPGLLPNPGIEPMSLTSPALTGWFFTTSATWEDQFMEYLLLIYGRHCAKCFTCVS